MFTGLFGKKKSAVPTNTVVSTIESTSEMLLLKEELLEERNSVLEEKSQNAAQDAIEANKAGKKQQALIYLNKHKLYEKEIANNNAMILKLIMQRSAVETITVHTDTLHVMKMANEVIKKQQSEWSSEKVTDMSEMMNKLVGDMMNITDLANTPMATCMVSAENLDAELAALERNTKAPFEDMNPLPR